VSFIKKFYIFDIDRTSNWVSIFVRQFPLIIIVTPFAEVNVTVPTPAVIVKCCVKLSKAVSLMLENWEALGGSCSGVLLSSLEQLVKAIDAKSKRLMFLMIS